MFSRVIILWFILATSWEVSAFTECGRSKFNSYSFNQRIVNGEDARKCEFPWQVNLEIPLGGNLMKQCGGSIIDKRTIVTAAHCVIEVRYSPRNVTVIAGDYIMGVPDGTEQRVVTDRIIIHPAYDSRIEYSDIAILKLSEPLNLKSDCISPICLPSKKQSFQGVCIASGWGRLKWGGSASEVLQKAVLPIFSDKICERNIPMFYPESQLCVGGGGKSACEGDSGGPLVCKDPYGKSYLAGITSYSIRQCEVYFPSVFTDVSFFTDWIVQFMDKNFYNR